MTQPALFTPPPTATSLPPRWAWITLLPDWVADHVLQATNRTGYDPAADTCRRCHAIILRALDDTHDGATTLKADPTMLTPQQELDCLLAHRTTITLHGQPFGNLTRPRLRSRNQWHIQNHPAGQQGPTLPAHRCRQPIGYPLPWEAI